ncbi:uncharacterized protein BO87DRAFT_164840 [Aspergillus neoniger CBS 115656]|uniref:Uncharacterized protein n=1 Tax=Aspergillus neoniger (strain CBS 115656) TaxID=1448310 RepID=A0A318ZD61_ASPNB|nr:hypothetical protein BO87DRAFT_164840 [Aspergillus neoniger CBS 115656]PYH38258.1 hypothetical protein BO87DRAFT_164840 [Aspergillus neoniger CBS 115656]
MVRMSQPSFETQRSTVSKFLRLDCQKLSPRIGNIVSHVPNTVDKRMAMRHLKQTCTGGQANEHEEPWPTAYQSRYVRGQLGNGYMICPPDDKCLGDLSTDKDSKSDFNPHSDLISFIFLSIRLHLAAPPILCLDSFRLSCLFEFVVLVSLILHQGIFGIY